MKKSTHHPLLYRTFALIGATALVTGLHHTAHATQLVRELFDNLPGYTVSDGITIDGMTNDATTVGLQGAWLNNPPGSTGIGYKGSWSVDWVVGNYDGTTLPHKAGIGGQNGCLNQFDGNLATLTNQATGLPYGTNAAEIYATHPLAPSAYIDCNANGTYYFSVRIAKAYSWITGPDSAGGLGVSTGNGANDHFVGIGVTRPTTLGPDGTTDWGNTDYVTTGTLGQVGLTNEFTYQPDTGGPYLPLAVGPAQHLATGSGADSWCVAGLVVGRLTTAVGGACTLDVFTYLRNTTPDLLNPPVTWDASYSFTETNVMTHLLVWMHGHFFEYDALRIGTTWGDVIGLEIIGKPQATPSSTEFAGTDVTLAIDGQRNTDFAPLSYQWLSNGVPLLDATASTLALTNTTTNFTADYSVIVTNNFGVLTSAVTHVTFNGIEGIYFTSKPVSITRYLGATDGSFEAHVNGTPPYTYQWIHAGTNYGPATTTNATVDKLMLPTPITLAEAGDYSVTVANVARTTNSGNVQLTVTVPPVGSFAAAVTALSPWAYWRLDNVTLANPTLADEWGNNNGVVVDPNYPTYQAPAAPYAGFPNPHKGLGIVNNGVNACRVNLPKFTWTNQMTLVAWVNNGGFQMVPMNAYGNGYGLQCRTTEGVITNELVFHWASLGAPSGGGGLATGLQMPSAGWAFVALVVQPDQATIYVGNDNSNLVSATVTGLALPTSDEAGDTANLMAPGLGRMQWPYSEDGGGQPWNTRSATWSDVAIFFHTLSASSITNLYLSGVGQAIYTTVDGGNLNMNWNPAFTLQQADAVTGPWTDVSGSPVSPLSLPINPALPERYYRLRQ